MEVVRLFWCVCVCCPFFNGPNLKAKIWDHLFKNNQVTTKHDSKPATRRLLEVPILAALLGVGANRGTKSHGKTRTMSTRSLLEGHQKNTKKMHGNSTKTWVSMTNRRSHALKMWRCLQPQIPTIRGVQLVETVSHGNKFMLQWRRFLTIPSQAQPWPNHFLSSKQRWNWWKTNGFGWIWYHPPPLNVCLLQKLLYFSAIDSCFVIIHGLGYYP